MTGGATIHHALVDEETASAEWSDVEASETLRAIVRDVDARVAATLTPHALSVAEWRLLSVLRQGGVMPPSLLAAQLGLTRGGVTKLIDRLRIRRFVVRAGAGGADRRYQTIALTGAGAVLVRELAEAVSASAALRPAERQAITRATQDGEA